MRQPTCATGDVDWEFLWAPYDEATYQAVLDQIKPGDIVIDIGAGDLRLAFRMAKLCQRVYAVEMQPELFPIAWVDRGEPLWNNIQLIRGDARTIRFPQDVMVGVLLMRHCRHFNLYANKLKAQGGERLITNARWRMGIEVIHLQPSRAPYQQVSMGWYACWCGAVGFKAGPPERLTPQLEGVIHEVIDCPLCEAVFSDKE